MMDSSALLDALLHETEDEDEQSLSDAISEFFHSGDHAGADAVDATNGVDRREDSLGDIIDLVDAATPSEESTPSDESEPGGPSAGTAKPRKPSTKQRERAEILRLRAEEKELRKELTRMQLHKQDRRTDTQGETTALSSVTNGEADAQTAQQQTSALWLRVAKSQLERRQNAHVENLKLRHMLDHQVKIMQGMQKLLRKRSTSSVRSLSACCLIFNAVMV